MMRGFGIDRKEERPNESLIGIFHWKTTVLAAMARLMYARLFYKTSNLRKVVLPARGNVWGADLRRRSQLATLVAGYCTKNPGVPALN